MLVKKALHIFLGGVWKSRKIKQFDVFNIPLTTILKCDTTTNAAIECKETC